MSDLLIIMGFIFLILGLGVSGALGSGDRIRANYTSEDVEDRSRRYKLTIVFILLSLILFGIRYLFY